MSVEQTEPCGLWVATGETDYVLYGRDSPPILRLQTILHELMHIALRHAGHAALSWGTGQVAGLLLSAGAAFGAAFVAHKALFLGLKLADLAPPWPEPVVTQTLVTFSVVLICSSFVLATLWKAVDGVRAWPRRSAMYRDLHALWYLLYQAVPDIVLVTPRRPRRDPWWVFGVEQRLYRRCVEIGDGIQALGPQDAQVRAVASGRAAELGWDQARAAAAGEAAAILVAVRRLEQGRVVRREVEPDLEATAGEGCTRRRRGRRP
ncbi:hypothetical protein JMF97_24605 [Micromonospora fiedleri]|uniref:DUF6545 domain-containing protein n=1 Tax=Micromonospora fiedleri TaxID=1157498 RepID=A0ABS1UU45_9ACTN|nr:DUF6545 domain-containing protein [Micromonospora fiedleri]MBL6279339.1 hypothetical protein [Micromonospora fiedleri]